jgi:two-component system, NtrC family, response regulator GlrR
MNDRSRPITTSLGFGITPRAKGSASRKEAAAPPPEHRARILVVDQDPEMRRLMSTRLGAANYTVATVAGAQAALDACVRSRPNLVITDWRLEDMDGFALLKELKGRWPDLTVIILTAHGSIPEAVQATQYGAFGFLVKPVDKAELLGQVQRAIADSTFTLAEGDWRAGIVSRGKLMEERLGQANWAAGSDAPVLLTGENGTGKELFARAIHAASARREKPFITVNCRAFAEHSLELELFGHQGRDPGSADAGPSGAIHAARGGTLLLDEIGDLPVRLQVNLIEALRKEPIHLDGVDRQTRTGARLICATSCDLKRLMNAGKFRQDLYYQINILPIEIPPLGRRREDIPLLISHFLEQATEQSGREKIYSAKAIQLLATTDWPGNVRQLFELVKQNVALSRGAVMTTAFVKQSLGSDVAQLPTYDEARDTFSRDYLTSNLQKTKGNISKSARLAKRNRTDFYRLLARYRILADDFKNTETSIPISTPD